MTSGISLHERQPTKVQSAFDSRMRTVGSLRSRCCRNLISRIDSFRTSWPIWMHGIHSAMRIGHWRSMWPPVSCAAVGRWTL